MLSVVTIEKGPSRFEESLEENPSALLGAGFQRQKRDTSDLDQSGGEEQKALD